ncbi:hypothetical protein SGLAM104S_07071 [Streptomyces glaucescens]
MSDACTSQPLPADRTTAPGHGKHRGPVSAHDTESAPRGRHRKPVEQQTETAAYGTSIGMTHGPVHLTASGALSEPCFRRRFGG